MALVIAPFNEWIKVVDGSGDLLNVQKSNRGDVMYNVQAAQPNPSNRGNILRALGYFEPVQAALGESLWVKACSKNQTITYELASGGISQAQLDLEIDQANQVHEYANTADMITAATSTTGDLVKVGADLENDFILLKLKPAGNAATLADYEVVGQKIPATPPETKDTAPTAGSTNAVESQGIKTALDAVQLSVTTETVRATAAEALKADTTALNAEIARATAVEALKADKTELHDGPAQDTAIAANTTAINAETTRATAAEATLIPKADIQTVIRDLATSEDTKVPSEKAVRALFDALNITGDFIGSSATFAALPILSGAGKTAVNGDWATLTAVDGVNLRGVYLYDGATYSFAFEIPDFLVLTSTQLGDITDTTPGLVSGQTVFIRELARQGIRAHTIATDGNQLIPRSWQAETLTNIFVQRGTTSEKNALGVVPSNTPFFDTVIGKMQRYDTTTDAFQVVFGTTHQPYSINWPTNSTSGSGVNFKVTEDPDAVSGVTSINLPDGTQKQIWVVAQQVVANTPSVGGAGTLGGTAIVRNDGGIISLVSVPSESRWNNSGSWATLSYNQLPNLVASPIGVTDTEIQRIFSNAAGAGTWINADGTLAQDQSLEDFKPLTAYATGDRFVAPMPLSANFIDTDGAIVNVDYIFEANTDIPDTIAAFDEAQADSGNYDLVGVYRVSGTDDRVLSGTGTMLLDPLTTLSNTSVSEYIHWTTTDTPKTIRLVPAPAFVTTWKDYTGNNIAQPAAANQDFILPADSQMWVHRTGNAISITFESNEASTGAASEVEIISRSGSHNPGNGNPFQHSNEHSNQGSITYAAGIYTIGVDGLYDIDASLNIANGTSAGNVQARVFINGTVEGPVAFISNDGVANFPGSGAVMISRQLAVGDTVEFRQQATPGFNVNKETSMRIATRGGPRGAAGVDAASIDHISRTSGDGSPGTTDTYTLWGDAGEAVNLGTYGVPIPALTAGTPNQFESGTRLVQNGIEPGSSSGTVTFPEAFKAGTIPTVTAVVQGTGDNANVTLQTVTNTGFTSWIVRNESDVGVNYDLHWVAMGEKA